jgi:hypothetical protein
MPRSIIEEKIQRSITAMLVSETSLDVGILIFSKARTESEKN